jgi:hypothetical protein
VSQIVKFLPTKIMIDGWIRTSRLPVAVWLASRIFLTVWGAVLLHLGILPVGPEGLNWGQQFESTFEKLFLSTWVRSDTRYYVDMVIGGYSYDVLSSYFPLYPFLARILVELTGIKAIFALQIISSLSFLLVLILLKEMARTHFDLAFADRLVLLTAFFPTAYYFHAGYPHALALCLVLVAVIAGERKKWLISGLAGFASGLTHSTVLPISAALAILVYQQYRDTRLKRTWLLFLVSGMPILGTATFFSWRIHGGFPDYNLIQSYVWMHIIRPPWETLWIGFLEVFSISMTAKINFLMLILSIAAAVWAARWTPAAWGGYHALTILLLLVASSLAEALNSYSRYILVQFPVFFALASWTRAEKSVFQIVLLICFFTFALLSAIFLMGYWIA